jgi:hypothetical protein
MFLFISFYFVCPALNRGFEGGSPSDVLFFPNVAKLEGGDKPQYVLLRRKGEMEPTAKVIVYEKPT